MDTTKANIISQLQKDINSLQGSKITSKNALWDIGLGSIKNAFPNNEFPLGAIHEFIYTSAEDAAVTSGFVSTLLASLMQHNRVSAWISPSGTIFPTALHSFGIAPDKTIFIDVKREKEILWVMEEALKCNSLTAVVAALPELSFTTSRRLQLAVEKSRVTGFILRCNPRNLNTTACVTRWKITSLPSELLKAMPGVGFPRWNVELLKVRNGYPGQWQVAFSAGRFRHFYRQTVIYQDQQKKTG